MSEAYSVSRVGRNGHTPDGPSIDPSRARSLLFDQVTANPFRTLGVPADAARSDLHASAASLRRAFKLGTTSRTDWDLDWLSPLVRAEGTLQMALGRIGTIDQRLVGRAFWFGSEALANLKAYEVRKQPVSTWPAGRTNEHDSALFALLHRIESDANVEDVSGWTKRLKAWVVALGDGAYWNWVLDADRAGGFMPLAAEFGPCDGPAICFARHRSSVHHKSKSSPGRR